MRLGRPGIFTAPRFGGVGPGCREKMRGKRLELYREQRVRVRKARMVASLVWTSAVGYGKAKGRNWVSKGSRMVQRRGSSPRVRGKTWYQ